MSKGDSIDPLSRFSKLNKISKPARLRTAINENTTREKETETESAKSNLPINLNQKNEKLNQNKIDSIRKNNEINKSKAEQKDQKIVPITNSKIGSTIDRESLSRNEKKSYLKNKEKYIPVSTSEITKDENNKLLTDYLQNIKKRRFERAKIAHPVAEEKENFDFPLQQNLNQEPTNYRYQLNSTNSSKFSTNETDQNDSQFIISRYSKQRNPMQQTNNPLQKDNELPPTFSQEWIDKKQKILRKRAKREHNKKLATIVIQHWKNKAAHRIYALREKKFQRKRLLSFAFYKWRISVFGNTHQFSVNDNIFDSIARSTLHNSLNTSSLQKASSISQHMRFEDNRNTNPFIKSENHISNLPIRSSIDGSQFNNYKMHSNFSNLNHVSKLERESGYWQLHFIVSTRHDFLLKQNFFHYWAQRTQLQQYERQTEQRKFSMATSHYIRQLKLSAFRAWKQTVQNMHKKQKNNERAYIFLYTASLRKAFNAWKASVEIGKKEKKLEIIAYDFYLTNLIRATFNHFRFILQELKEYNKTIIKVEQFYIFCLKRKSFHAFKKLLVRKSRKIEETKIINQFTNQSLKRLYFKNWIYTIVNRNEEKKRKKYEKARLFYEKRRKQEFINKWRKGSILSKIYRNQKIAADKFWFQNNIPGIFFHFKSISMTKRKIRSMKEIAISHHKNNLLKKSFSKLYDYFYKKTKESEDYAIANCFWRKIILKKSFMIWIQRVNSIYEMEHRLEDAKNYYHQKLIHNIFCQWKQIVIKNKQHQADKEIANEFHSFNLMKKSFFFWQQQIHSLREIMELYDQAIQYHNKTILQKHWNAWKNYILYRREKEKLIQISVNNIKKKLDELKKLRFFSLWKQWHQNQIRKKINWMRAEKHNIQLQKSRAWKSWILFIHMKNYHKEQKKKAQQFYEIQLKKCSFIIMKQEFTIEQEIHKKEYKAMKYHDKILQKQYIQLWKLFVARKKDYESKKIEAIEMRQNFFKKFALRRISCATRDHREERLPFLNNLEIDQKTLQSYQLLVKYFRRWRIVLSEKHNHPAWNVPRRGKPRSINLTAFEKNYSEILDSIDPRPDIDKLLDNPIVERPKPRLSSTLYSMSTRESNNSRELLQSNVKYSSKELNKPNNLSIAGLKSQTHNLDDSMTMKNDLSFTHFDVTENPLEIHDDISLSDFQNQTQKQYQDELSPFSLHQGTRDYIENNKNPNEIIINEIKKIQEAVQGILSLKNQYNKDKDRLNSLKQEIKEFPFSKNSIEFQIMIDDMNKLEENIQRFKLLKDEKLPQLKHVLQKKISKLREII